MKSTGEVLGIDNCFEKALIKAFIGAGTNFTDNGEILISLNKRDLVQSLKVTKKIEELGFSILATEGNAEFFEQNNVKVTPINKEDLDLIRRKIKNGEIKIMLNTPNKGGNTKTAGFKIRAMSTQYKTPCFTCLDTFEAYLQALEYYRTYDSLTYKTIDEYI
jgi:carbamoyl-phosphate synthase large subunit